MHHTAGAQLNPRGPPGLMVVSPFLQSMQLPGPVRTMQRAAPPPPAGMHFTSADLRSQSSVVFQPRNPGSQMGFSAFSQRAPESIHSSQLFSPWSQDANALQLRDSNQQNLFNSSLMLHKHNELGIKAEGQCKTAPPPPPSPTPTWSQVAAKDPQQLTRCNSSTTVVATDAIEAKTTSTMQVERTVSAIPFVKEDMDLDMAEACATPASPLQTASVVLPLREPRYITDSLAFISSGVNSDQNISVVRPYTVLKIKNVLPCDTYAFLFCTDTLYR